MSSERYIALDEEGYFAFDGRRVEDPGLGATLLKSLNMDDRFRLTTAMEGQSAIVEAFDAPLVARHLEPGPDGMFTAVCPYGFKTRVSLSTLCVDEWDRFHGLSEQGVPLVFSRQAQIEFFDLLDSFDDDSITVQGREYPVPTWLKPETQASSESFWTRIYREEQPGWELGQETPVLPIVLPQLKLSKSRVLVLGAGSGHDAAYFARQGHVVTAVDFSPEAVARAKANYSHLENLRIVQADAFNLPANWAGNFDLVFEHTCYCAITPERRNELTGVWNRMLHSQGHLLGVFFVMDKRVGPPFGGSEWEVRERLKKRFEFLFWTRWRHSLEHRRGLELVVYARKRA